MGSDFQRLRPGPIDDAVFDECCALCDEVESSSSDDEALEALLARWHVRANRRYELPEFKSYSASTTKEQFVKRALMPKVERIEDLRFGEATAAVEAVMKVKLPESELWFVLDALQVNLPGSELSDLIYWPDAWFGDESLLHVEMSPAQIIAYAQARSGRTLRDAPEVEMPYPVPPRHHSAGHQSAQ